MYILYMYIVNIHVNIICIEFISIRKFLQMYQISAKTSFLAISRRCETASYNDIICERLQLAISAQVYLIKRNLVEQLWFLHTRLSWDYHTSSFKSKSSHSKHQG